MLSTRQPFVEGGHEPTYLPCFHPLPAHDAPLGQAVGRRSAVPSLGWSPVNGWSMVMLPAPGTVKQ